MNNSGIFEFREKYSNKIKRRNKKIGYFVIYGALIYLAIFPVMYSGEATKELGVAVVAPLLLWLLVFVVWAISALEVGMSIGSGERFIEEQAKKI